MFMNFRKKNSSVFLDSTPRAYLQSGRVDIILSPALYWFQKSSLPIKSLREFKKLLPSIFEDFLPKGRYSFTAYKNGDIFYAFAYEDKMIIDILVQSGIVLSDVAGVYFAQNELGTITGNIATDEKNALHVKDGVLIKIPLTWVQESTQLDLKWINLSKNRVTLEAYGHIVESTKLHKIMAVLTVFICLVGGRYFVTLHKVDTLESQTLELFEKNSLQPTMIQNRSILDSYKKIYNKQSKLRDATAKILALELLPTQRLNSLEFKGDFLRANFDLQAPMHTENIIKELHKKGSDFKTEVTLNRLRVEAEL